MRSRVKSYHYFYSGFTIVELLVVIVVIGVLVTIAFISYNGITNRAIVASLQSDLSNASTQLKLFNIDKSAYPATVSTDCSINPDDSTNKCLPASGETTYTYKLSSSNNNIYCLMATKSSISYHLAQDGQTLAGPCPVINLNAGNDLSYPGSGANWYDLSGHDNNGTMYGGVLYSSSDNSMNFDRVDDYIDTGIPPSLVTPTFSGSFWVSRVGAPSNDIDVPSRLITARKGASSTLWAVGVGGSNQLKVMAFNGSAHIYKSGSILNENTIYNIQFSYDDSTLKLYKNGVLDIELAISIPDLSYQTLIIGDLDTGNRRLWSGKIYSAQLVNFALSEQEVFYNYNSMKLQYGL